ncbi:uncharacterized protein BP5553_07161 [Venustampulla echinocandica]|uniref:Uncharacterized protein n=1 Tax=Venustampulla echinocandica TaxID=2656787 RepID=A0A370TIR2_9HELO|nr:uncharacterized protein BP5553_07161 [Venustampulla echinocandica]RDL35230.1 hypothetical protein BP5553_07161 [Venustampulla echinocandica]
MDGDNASRQKDEKDGPGKRKYSGSQYPTKDWASSIAEQPLCPLFKLPTELRIMVWQYALGLDHSHPIILSPDFSGPLAMRRQGFLRFYQNVFTNVSTSSPAVIPVYLQLRRLSRQAYVDIVMSGLLYKNAIFLFQDTLSDYLPYLTGGKPPTTLGLLFLA